MKTKHLLISVTTGLMVLALLPFALIALHPALAGFIHRQTIYRFISSEVAKGCGSDMERTMSVMAWVHLHETRLNDWSLAEDRDVLHDLVRNVGWCDQQSNAMAHLLLPLGIDARMVMFPCHTFAEVRVDGRPLLFDPTYNSYFFIHGSADSIATLADLRSRPDALMTRHGLDMDAYPRNDVRTCGRPQLWTWLPESTSVWRKAVIHMLQAYLAVGGGSCARALDHWYFTIHSRTEPPLYRARCLQLLGQSEEAMEVYRADGSLVAAFFLFQTLVEAGRYEEALQALNSFRETPSAPEHAYYTEVMQDYLLKLQSLNGSELSQLFRLDGDGLSRMIAFLGML